MKILEEAMALIKKAAVVTVANFMAIHTLKVTTHAVIPMTIYFRYIMTYLAMGIYNPRLNSHIGFQQNITKNRLISTPAKIPCSP